MDTHSILLEHNDIIVNREYPFIARVYIKPNLAYSYIFDNIHSKRIFGYALDYSPAETIAKDMFMVFEDWHLHHSDKPLSLRIEQLGLKNQMYKFYKSFHFNKIERIEGPIFNYIDKPKTTKRVQLK